MYSIVSKGKTITEAIHLGLEILEVTTRDVDIEIIQREVKGFFGIRSKEAIVKLTKIEKMSLTKQERKQDSNDLLEQFEQLIDSPPGSSKENVNSHQEILKQKVPLNGNMSEANSGKVWVEEGKLYYTFSPRHYPMVTLKKGVQLFNNGKLVTEKTLVLSEQDTYELKVQNEECETKWQVEMDKHKLKVLLKVEPGYKVTRQIPDIEPSQHIQVFVKEKKEVYNQLNYEVILKKLKSLKVIYGIVVTEAGRPKIEKRGQFVKVSIMRKHTQYGDVDLTSGNIHFSGDVEVLGSVNEGMLIEAEGDLLIHKEVNKASLISSGAIITYGNIVGSEVSAGKNDLLIAELGQLIGALQLNVEKMLLLINQLTQSSSYKSSDYSKDGLKPVLSILLEKRFKNFPSIAKKYVSIVKQSGSYLIDQEWKEVAVDLTQLFLSFSSDVISQERIIQLSQKMKQLHDMSQTPVEPNSYILIPSASNSRLYSSGNITINGKGCVNTKIHAEGFLKINGVIRGGEVYGRLGADIFEAGANIGTPTLIAVPRGQTINIVKAMDFQF